MLLLATAALSMVMRPTINPRSPTVTMFGGAPPEIYEKLKPTNSGTGSGLASKREIDAIWSSFEGAFGSRAAALEASGKKATGGLHKFDASEVDAYGGDATADDFLDAFGF